MVIVLLYSYCTVTVVFVHHVRMYQYNSPDHLLSLYQFKRHQILFNEKGQQPTLLVADVRVISTYVASNSREIISGP